MQRTVLARCSLPRDVSGAIWPTFFYYVLGRLYCIMCSLRHILQLGYHSYNRVCNVHRHVHVRIDDDLNCCWKGWTALIPLRIWIFLGLGLSFSELAFVSRRRRCRYSKAVVYVIIIVCQGLIQNAVVIGWAPSDDIWYQHIVKNSALPI